MFSGIVRDKGIVTGIEAEVLGVRCALFETEQARPGDSFSVSGVCLTVRTLEGSRAWFDLATETRKRTSLGSLREGDSVNLEPSLKLGDAIHGHFVQGHVDCVAEVLKIERLENTIRALFALPRELSRFVAEKGSIAVDGVSLTVGEVSKDSFSVYLIPHTLAETTLIDLLPGRLVNLEADCIAKYLEKLAAPYDRRSGKRLLW